MAQQIETSFHHETPTKVITLLETFCKVETRIRIEYGDQKTGKSWGDILTGYVSRSSGRMRVPILVPNSRSRGGPAILDHCIVRISYANKTMGGVLYQHHHYKPLD